MPIFRRAPGYGQQVALNTIVTGLDEFATSRKTSVFYRISMDMNIFKIRMAVEDGMSWKSVSLSALVKLRRNSTAQPDNVFRLTLKKLLGSMVLG
jgi:hypothetical protein